MVKDTRTNHETYTVGDVLDGKIDDFITKFLEQAAAAQVRPLAACAVNPPRRPAQHHGVRTAAGGAAS